MALERIVSVTGRAVYVPGNDIDTDRIIPARFMKCVTFDGLGQYMFHDVRYAENGTRRVHPLNDERFAGASVLLSNNNFGCGSSREHAPQAIAKSGFRAIVAEGFAEIFFGNATTLGIPCVTVSHDAVVAIAAAIEKEPQLAVTVDLQEQVVVAGGERFRSQMKPSAREVLMQGLWDPIGALLDASAKTREVAAGLPYVRFA